MCTSPFTEQQPGQRWRRQCAEVQEDKYIRVSSLKDTCLAGPQLAASLISGRKTPYSLILKSEEVMLVCWPFKQSFKGKTVYVNEQ